MGYWIEWQVKAALIMAVMAIVFVLFLAKDALFNRNRYWLLSSLVMPWVVPVLTMPAQVKGLLFKNETALTTTTLTIFETGTTSQLVNQKAIVDWSDVLIGIYLMVSLLLLVRLIFGYRHLFKLKSKSKKLTFRGLSLYLMDDNSVNPFSFFQSVFVPKSVMDHPNRYHILNHERAHCRQWHSVDITLAEWVLILQWWNPFAWWLRKLIAQNHEFCVDKAMMQIAEEPKQYQYSLMNYLPGSKRLKLVNNFSQSLIKKRIIMMNIKTDRKLFTGLKSLIVMLVTLLTLVAFTNPDRADGEQKKTQEADKIQTVDDLRKFVAQNIKYPIEARDLNLTGEVTANVDISKNGKVGMPKIGASAGADVVNSGEIVVTAYASETKEKGETATAMADLESEVKRVMAKLPMIADVNLLGKTLELKVKFVLQESEQLKGTAMQIENNQLPSDAIIYLDGVRFKGDISQISSNKIASVNVLKGAAAVEKYGETIAGGVIEITTKNSSDMVSEDKVVEVKTIQKDDVGKTIQITSNASHNGKDPLFILDGVEMSSEQLKEIKPDTIDRIEVLKGDAATSIYGEKGKNGVVLIYSK